MKLKKIAVGLMISGLAATILNTTAQAAAANGEARFAVTQRYTLNGSDNWDYLGMDTLRHHLFVSRATHVQVIDTISGKQIADIANTEGVHGFAFAQDLKTGFISNGHANTVSVFDLDTLKIVATIDVAGRNPDAIVFSPALERVYTGNGGSRSVSVFDAVQRKLIGTVGIGGKPESMAVDGKGMIFVNLEDKNEIVAIDGKNNTVSARWPLAGCDEPSGLAIDVKSSRLFAVCSNKHLVVVNAKSGQRIATLPIGNGPDAAAFDPVLNMVFSSNGEDGTLTVIHEIDADHYRVAQTLKTQAGARTLALDEAGHQLFVVSAKPSENSSESGGGTHAQNRVVESSFQVLAIQRAAKK